jgi:spore germination cell wall hydrolase CwlJ-like protein
MLSAKLLLAYILQTADVSGLSIDKSQIDLDQAYCLAKNVYYEAKGESLKGQFAVANVTLNRVNNPRFPGSICEVVKFSAFHRGTKNLVCAFSWYCEKNKGDRPIVFVKKDGTVDQRAVDQFHVASIVALKTMGGVIEDNTRGATHFHNPFTSFPAWRHDYKRTMRIGNHDFYRM